MAEIGERPPCRSPEVLGNAGYPVSGISPGMRSSSGRAWSRLVGVVPRKLWSHKSAYHWVARSNSLSSWALLPVPDHPVGIPGLRWRPSASQIACYPPRQINVSIEFHSSPGYMSARNHRRKSFLKITFRRSGRGRRRAIWSIPHLDGVDICPDNAAKAYKIIDCVTT